MDVSLLFGAERRAGRGRSVLVGLEPGGDLGANVHGGVDVLDVVEVLQEFRNLQHIDILFLLHQRDLKNIHQVPPILCLFLCLDSLSFYDIRTFSYGRSQDCTSP